MLLRAVYGSWESNIWPVLASRATLAEICFGVGPTLDQCPVCLLHWHRVRPTSIKHKVERVPDIYHISVYKLCGLCKTWLEVRLHQAYS